MAYRVGRAKRITENLELMTTDGTVARKIEVDLDAEKIATEFNTRYNVVIRAEKAAKVFQSVDKNASLQEHAQAASDALQLFGEAAISLFELVFGEEDTAIILNYFEGRYVEMVSQIVPFLKDVISPAIARYAQEAREQMADNYKLSQAQRRSLGL